MSAVKLFSAIATFFMVLPVNGLTLNRAMLLTILVNLPKISFPIKLILAQLSSLIFLFTLFLLSAFIFPILMIIIALIAGYFRCVVSTCPQSVSGSLAALPIRNLPFDYLFLILLPFISSSFVTLLFFNSNLYTKKIKTLVLLLLWFICFIVAYIYAYNNYLLYSFSNSKEYPKESLVCELQKNNSINILCKGYIPARDEYSFSLTEYGGGTIPINSLKIDDKLLILNKAKYGIEKGEHTFAIEPDSMSFYDKAEVSIRILKDDKVILENEKPVIIKILK